MEETNSNVPNELEFEEVKALYFDEDALVEPTYRLHRVDGGGNRYYYILNESLDPTFYISVTSLINATLKKGYGFHKWLAMRTEREMEYERDSRGAFGDMMHIEFANLLIDGSFDLDKVRDIVEIHDQDYPELHEEWEEELKKDILAFLAFVKERNVNPLAVEIGLSADSIGEYREVPLAGCVDFVCELEFNGKTQRALIDFKSKQSSRFYESNVLQLEAYRRLWEQNYPDKPIDLIFNWSPKDWRKKPGYNLKNQTKDDSRQKLDALIDEWVIDNPEGEPDDVMNLEGEVSMDQEDFTENYQVITLSDAVKNKHKDQNEGQ